MKPKLIFAWTGIIFIGFLPVLLLLIFGPGNYSSITHTFGQISGLIGMTFFALSFLLSTRAKWIEDLFEGLDKVYPIHTTLGAISLLLLLMHPLFLVMKFIPDKINLAAKYMLPGGFLSVDLGIFALLGMIILIVMALYAKIKYNKWKLSHEFLGFFFILAVIHIFLIRTDVARDYIFKGYVVYAVIVSAIGLISFGYSLLRNNLLGKKYKIIEINKLKNSYEIILGPINKGIRYLSGQFVFVKFYNKKISKETHPFSITSPTGKGTIRIIAKDLGDYTKELYNLKKGDLALVEGPYGRFHRKKYVDEVWVAGGIGITPFLGLSSDFAKNKDKKIDLFYCVNYPDEFIRLEELQTIAKHNKNFRVFSWISKEKGFLTVKDIEKETSLNNKEYYLCGPQGLKDSIRRYLIKRGISDYKIHDERFAFK